MAQAKSKQNFPKLNPSGANPREVAFRVNQLVDGKTNNTAEFTLDPNATMTQVDDYRVGANSAIFITPISQSAAVEVASGNLYVGERGKHYFKVMHTDLPATDREFMLVVIG